MPRGIARTSPSTGYEVPVLNERMSAKGELAVRELTEQTRRAIVDRFASPHLADWCEICDAVDGLTICPPCGLTLCPACLETGEDEAHGQYDAVCRTVLAEQNAAGA